MKGMQSVKEYSATYRMRLVLIGLLVFLIHGAKLYSDVIGIDTEDIIHLQDDFYGGWLNSGRQGLIFMKYLLGNNLFNPYFISLTTLLLFIISIVAFLFLWDRVGGKLTMGQAASLSHQKKESLGFWAWGLGGLLWVSHPVMVEQFYFSLQSLEICISLLLTAISLYLSYRWAEKRHPALAVATVVLLLLTFSSYQTFVVLYIFGTVSVLFLQTLEDVAGNRKLSGMILFKRMIPYCILFSIAFIVNMLITRLFFSSSTYLQDQILWGTASVKDCIHVIINHVIKAFTGIRSVFYHWGLGVLTLFDLILLIKFLRRYGEGRKTVIGMTVFYYLALFVPPFMMTVLLGHSPAIRSQLVLPAVTGYLGYLGIWFLRKEISESRFWKAGFILIVAVGFITGLEQTKVTESLYYTDKCRYEQDAALGRAFIERIAQVNQGDDSLPVIVIGSREFTGNHSCVTGEIIGRSFFCHDVEVSPQFYWSTRRILGFLHCLGSDYAQLPQNRLWEAQEYSKDMPVWPSEGSVQEKNGMIIIKLSEM